MTKPLVAGNWKMHGNANTAAELAEQLALHDSAFVGVEVVVFPPAVHLDRVSAAAASSTVRCRRSEHVPMGIWGLYR